MPDTIKIIRDRNELNEGIRLSTNKKYIITIKANKNADAIIPIVFPDHKITVETPKIEFDLLPWTELDDITIPPTKQKLSYLGHAGVLFINGKSGLTKYYEYGRYDRAGLGLVRRVPISNVLLKNNSIDLFSLKKPLLQLSKIAGQPGDNRISAVYIEVKNKFGIMLKEAERRKMQNGDSQRKPYGITTNNCIHFVKEIAKSAGVDAPWMIDPRPNSYIGEFREDYPDLDYNPETNTLIIEGKGEF